MGLLSTRRIPTSAACPFPENIESRTKIVSKLGYETAV